MALIRCPDGKGGRLADYGQPPPVEPDLPYRISVHQRRRKWWAVVESMGIVRMDPRPEFKGRTREEALAKAKRWCIVDAQPQPGPDIIEYRP